MGKDYRPPVTSFDARHRLARDIDADHRPRRSNLRLGRLWARLRGPRCTAPTCRHRWPCPEAMWAQRELARGQCDEQAGAVYVAAQVVR